MKLLLLQSWQFTCTADSSSSCENDVEHKWTFPFQRMETPAFRVVYFVCSAFYTKREWYIYGIYVKNTGKYNWTEQKGWTEEHWKRERLWWGMVMMVTYVWVRDQTRAGLGCLRQGKQGLAHKVCSCFATASKVETTCPLLLRQAILRFTTYCCYQKIEMECPGWHL